MTSTIDAATQTARPTFTPTAEELASFQQRGYLGPFDVYGEDEMRSLWRRERLRLMDRSEAVYDEDAYAGNTNIANYDRHLDSTFLADHICRPEIVDRVAAVLGPDVLCWRSEFFPKYPGDEGTDWHQADTFAFASGKPQIVWPDDQREQFGGTITVWTAFTEAAEDTGCLQFIPGTQRTMNYDESRGMHYSPDLINGQEKDGVNRGFYGYDYRELQKDPDWRPAEDQAVSMVMKPGQAILFWSTLMHASKPHSAPDKPMRLGFAGRYVPTCVDVYPDTDDVDEYGGRVSLAEYGAVLVSGTDRYTHNRKVTETTRGHRFPKR